MLYRTTILKFVRAVKVDELQMRKTFIEIPYLSEFIISKIYK